jgi:hypothetical protein
MRHIQQQPDQDPNTEAGFTTASPMLGGCYEQDGLRLRSNDQRCSIAFADRGICYRGSGSRSLEEIFVRKVNAFLAARGSSRTQWIDATFGNEYPADLSEGEIIADILHSCEAELSLSIAECSNCGRLWLQEEPGLNQYRSYAPDKPGYSRRLAARGIKASP